jgi:hypothetical protein
MNQNSISVLQSKQVLGKRGTRSGYKTQAATLKRTNDISKWILGERVGRKADVNQLLIQGKDAKSLQHVDPVTEALIICRINFEYQRISYIKAGNKTKKYELKNDAKLFGAAILNVKRSFTAEKNPLKSFMLFFLYLSGLWSITDFQTKSVLNTFSKTPWPKFGP